MASSSLENRFSQGKVLAQMHFRSAIISPCRRCATASPTPANGRYSAPCCSSSGLPLAFPEAVQLLAGKSHIVQLRPHRLLAKPERKHRIIGRCIGLKLEGVILPGGLERDPVPISPKP